MKRSIRVQVKFNFTLHIQLIFQLVQKRINWLLSNGTNLRQILKPDFTAKPMMMMMKDAMLSFGRTSVTKLIEIIGKILGAQNCSDLQKSHIAAFLSNFNKNLRSSAKLIRHIFLIGFL